MRGLSLVKKSLSQGKGLFLRQFFAVEEAPGFAVDAPTPQKITHAPSHPVTLTPTHPRTLTHLAYVRSTILPTSSQTKKEIPKRQSSSKYIFTIKSPHMGLLRICDLPTLSPTATFRSCDDEHPSRTYVCVCVCVCVCV